MVTHDKEVTCLLFYERHVRTCAPTPPQARTTLLRHQDSLCNVKTFRINVIQILIKQNELIPGVFATVLFHDKITPCSSPVKVSFQLVFL